MVGRTPLKRPKLDSIPHTAIRTPVGTPYFWLTCFSSAACFACIVRAVRTTFFDTCCCKY